MINSSVNALKPEEQATWDKVWSFYVGLPAYLDAQLKRDSGVSHFEFQALKRLAESENGSLRMSELAAAATMSLSHLSRVVTRLAKKGYVVRVPDPSDGRSTFATLTATGMAVVARALPGHQAQLGALLFDGISEEERTVFDGVLEKVAAVLAGGVSPLGSGGSPQPAAA
ncbi:MarR family winged helix-turn-helix transcriptional regulator [Corynebacterium aquatimens]|uniref:DNA-binding MarR family transcriptional regulator n=1 Tax=Corynebacterium aquatimens TaxID=1190508 RepID=A0A931GW82_9CORY|nr:MarR family transcriptional regulator [Corynebacterium aquatimens]MBG6122236.1 DNA-binding MarR family transcriptional regulator [Corynebacterium aquatimens]WJY65223.1 putative HTH-type transcriptional regulator [Corynebacterium aquatimens]